MFRCVIYFEVRKILLRSNEIKNTPNRVCSKEFNEFCISINAQNKYLKMKIELNIHNNKWNGLALLSCVANDFHPKRNAKQLSETVVIVCVAMVENRSQRTRCEKPVFENEVRRAEGTNTLTRTCPDMDQHTFFIPNEADIHTARLRTQAPHQRTPQDGKHNKNIGVE